MMISSVDVLPARSPMPLMAPSIWRAPAWIAARELATARPRSLWQCVETMTSSRSPFTCSYTVVSMSTNSDGVAYPTVSGMLMVVAPASTAALQMSMMNRGSERVASCGENSTSSTYWRARRTPSTAALNTSSGVIRSMLCM